MLAFMSAGSVSMLVTTLYRPAGKPELAAGTCVCVGCAWLAAALGAPARGVKWKRGAESDAAAGATREGAAAAAGSLAGTLLFVAFVLED